MKDKNTIRITIYKPDEIGEMDEDAVEMKFNPTLGKAVMACLLPLQPGEDELHRTIDMDKLRSYGLEGVHADFPDRLENLVDVSEYGDFDNGKYEEDLKRAMKKIIIVEEDPTDPQP